MDHNWAARKGNMSLDGGYNGSPQQAEANLYVGRNQGRQEGLKQGFEEGRSYGYSEGWDAGAACANEKLQPLRDTVRQYFTEAVQLRTQVQRQQTAIDLMHEHLSKMAQASAARPAGASAGAREAQLSAMVATLQSANEVLRTRAEVVDNHLQVSVERSRLLTEQHNQSLVVMQAAQALIRDLVGEDTPEARLIRERFAQHYQQQVAQGLREGEIKLAPEQDEAFRKRLPATHQFILGMLGSVRPGQDDDSPDPVP